MRPQLKDNGGRRIRATDRRQFLYSEYFPERRSGEERRKRGDRRRPRQRDDV